MSELTGCPRCKSNKAQSVSNPGSPGDLFVECEACGCVTPVPSRGQRIANESEEAARTKSEPGMIYG